MKTIPVKLLSLLFLFDLCAATRLPAQSTVGLNLDSGSYTLMNSNDLTPLAIGDVLQFGYYTGATAANPFAGTWVALTGNGGANSALSFTAIGKNPVNGAGAGTLAFTTSDITFTLGSATSGVSLPSAGQIMAVRFYDGTTLALSTHFGSASDASWDWVAPAATAPTPMSFSLDDPGIAWLNNSVAFTGIPNSVAAPEPSANQLFALGLALLALVYNRGRRLAVRIGSECIHE